MVDDTKLLEFICEDADMGRDAVHHVIRLTDDEGLRGVLERQLADYDNSFTSAERLLRERGEEARHTGPFAKAMTHMSSDMKTMTDRSPSKIAELMIQGSTMGITTMSKHINDYTGEDTGIVELAKKQVQMEQRNIEELKQFL